MAQPSDTVSLRITLRYKDLDEFVNRYAENISSAGLFLRTKSPKATGTKIRFELLLANGSRALRGEGVVVTVREDDKPGMALRFKMLDADSQAVIDRIVAKHGQGTLAPTPLSTNLGRPSYGGAAARPTSTPNWRASSGWVSMSGGARVPGQSDRTQSGSGVLPRRPARTFEGQPTKPVPREPSGSKAIPRAPLPRSRSSVTRPWGSGDRRETTGRIRVSDFASAREDTGSLSKPKLPPIGDPGAATPEDDRTLRMDVDRLRTPSTRGDTTLDPPRGVGEAQVATDEFLSDTDSGAPFGEALRAPSDVDTEIPRPIDDTPTAEDAARRADDADAIAEAASADVEAIAADDADAIAAAASADIEAIAAAAAADAAANAEADAPNTDDLSAPVDVETMPDDAAEESPQVEVDPWADALGIPPTQPPTAADTYEDGGAPAESRGDTTTDAAGFTNDEATHLEAPAFGAGEDVRADDAPANDEALGSAAPATDTSDEATAVSAGMHVVQDGDAADEATAVSTINDAGSAEDGRAAAEASADDHVGDEAREARHEAEHDPSARANDDGAEAEHGAREDADTEHDDSAADEHGAREDDGFAEHDVREDSAFAEHQVSAAAEPDVGADAGHGTGAEDAHAEDTRDAGTYARQVGPDASADAELNAGANAEHTDRDASADVEDDARGASADGRNASAYAEDGDGEANADVEHDGRDASALAEHEASAHAEHDGRDASALAEHEASAHAEHDARDASALAEHEASAHAEHDARDASALAERDVSDDATQDGRGASALAERDASALAERDVSADGTHDASADAEHDASAGVTHDVSADVTQDGRDASPDAEHDASAHAEHDASAHAEHDASADAAHDASADAAHDAGAHAEPDARDANADAEHDASAHAEPDARDANAGANDASIHAEHDASGPSAEAAHDASAHAAHDDRASGAYAAHDANADSEHDAREAGANDASIHAEHDASGASAHAAHDAGAHAAHDDRASGAYAAQDVDESGAYADQDDDEARADAGHDARESSAYAGYDDREAQAATGRDAREAGVYAEYDDREAQAATGRDAREAGVYAEYDDREARDDDVNADAAHDGLQVGGAPEHSHRADAAHAEDHDDAEHRARAEDHPYEAGPNTDRDAPVASDEQDAAEGEDAGDFVAGDSTARDASEAAHDATVADARAYASDADGPDTTEHDASDEAVRAYADSDTQASIQAPLDDEATVAARPEPEVDELESSFAEIGDELRRQVEQEDRLFDDRGEIDDEPTAHIPVSAGQTEDPSTDEMPSPLQGAAAFEDEPTAHILATDASSADPAEPKPDAAMDEGPTVHAEMDDAPTAFDEGASDRTAEEAPSQDFADGGETAALAPSPIPGGEQEDAQTKVLVSDVDESDAVVPIPEQPLDEDATRLERPEDPAVRAYSEAPTHAEIQREAPAATPAEPYAEAATVAAPETQVIRNRKRPAADPERVSLDASTEIVKAHDAIAPRDGTPMYSTEVQVTGVDANATPHEEVAPTRRRPSYRPVIERESSRPKNPEDMLRRAREAAFSEEATEVPPERTSDEQVAKRPVDEMPKRPAPPTQVVRARGPQAPSRAQRVVGIDFGGQWVRMGVIENSELDLIPAAASAYIPALVATRKDGSLVTGVKARALVLDDPRRGTSPRSVLQAIEKGKIPPGRAGALNVIGSEDGEVKLRLGDHVVDLQDVLVTYFTFLRDAIKQHLGTDTFSVAMLVPDRLDPSARKMLEAACKTSRLDVAQFVEESQAMLSAYNLRERPMKSVLLIDVGMTHVGIQVAKRNAEKFDIVASRWDDKLSAGAFDDRVVQLTLDELEAQAGEDHQADRAARLRLKEAVEHARMDIRRAASVELKVTLPAPGGASGVVVERSIKLPRSRIYQVTEDVVLEICVAVQEVLRDAGIDPRNLDATVLAGSGGTFPPLIEALTNLTQQEPMHSIPPAHVFAMGLAKSSAGIERAEVAGQANTLSASIGFGLPGGRFRPILQAGSKLPITIAKSYPTTKDGQTDVELKFYQGDAEFVRTCTYLGELTLTGLPRAIRGEVRIDLELSVAADGILSIRLGEKTNGVQNRLQVATAQTPQERRRALAARKPAVAQEPPQKTGGFFKRLFGRK